MYILITFLKKKNKNIKLRPIICLIVSQCYSSWMTIFLTEWLWVDDNNVLKTGKKNSFLFFKKNYTPTDWTRDTHDVTISHYDNSVIFKRPQKSRCCVNEWPRRILKKMINWIIHFETTFFVENNSKFILIGIDNIFVLYVFLSFL